MTSEVLAPQERALAARMLDEVNHPQYGEYLQDPQVKANVGSLVLSAARYGLPLTPAAIDYAIESFGRHGLSREEFASIVGNLGELDSAEAEDRLHRVHLACELSSYENGTPSKQGRAHNAARRVTAISALSDTIGVIEKEAGEKLDLESALEFADEYLTFTSFGVTTDEERSKIQVTDRLRLLTDADSATITELLRVKQYYGGQRIDDIVDSRKLPNTELIDGE